MPERFRTFRSVERTQRRFAWLVLTPVLLYFGTFVVLPIVTSFLYSFRDMQFREFVGLRNYREFLLEDPRGLVSLRNTAQYALIRIPITMILGFFIANALDGVRRGRGLLVFCFFSPYITSLVAFSSVFIYIYANNGLLNAIFSYLGIATVPFLTSTSTALPSVAVMDAWKHIGFDVIIFLAAMQSIPRQLYDSALIDGASRLQMVLHVKLPLIKPVVLYVAVMLFIWTFQVFEPVLVMTQGGPRHATRTMVYTIYQVGFQDFRLGYASAMAYVLFAIIFLVTMIQLKVGKTRWEY